MPHASHITGCDEYPQMGEGGQFGDLHGAEHVPDQGGKFKRRNRVGAEVQDHFSNTFRVMSVLPTGGDDLVDQSIQTTGPIKIEILNAITPIYL